MPDWEIELPDGRVVTITSDQPPTKADVLAQVQGDGSTGWGQTLSNFGVPETVGGLAGGAMAGLPGAMAGAAFGRVLRGGIAGEDPASVGGGALGAAALEGAIPGLGGLFRYFGLRGVRAALPIAEATAKEVGKGSAAEGATEIARRVADAPGLRLSKTARNVNRRLQTLGDLDESAMLSAGRSGQFVDLAPVRQAAADALAPGGRIHTQISSSATQRGAENVLRNTENRLFQGRPSLDPAEARAVLKNTEFVSGSPDVPGADAMVRTMRRALSEQYKTDVPGAASIFEEQHRLIPVQETLDRALFQGGSRPIQSAEVLISGGRPRMFGVVPLPRGATLGAGKTAYKMGKAAQAPVVPLTPGLLRALPFLTGTMRPVPSHESVR